MKKKINADILIFLIVTAIFFLYAAVFIYRTSVVVYGERYFTLFDDAMVSMRYAKNFVAGNGLVMNQGERVEGFTNPLWVLYMAFIHLLPVAQSKISLIIQITGAALFAGTFYMVMKIARFLSDNSKLVVAGALALTAFYLPLINWNLQGMEVSLVTLIITAGIWKAFTCLRESTVSTALYVLLGIGTLVRMDMVVPYLAVWLFLVMTQPELRKQNVIRGIVILSLFMVVQTALRVAYYGEFLPNTYYLKMTGFPVLIRIARGVAVYYEFVLGMAVVLFLLPFFVLIFRYNKFSGLCAAVFGSMSLYSIYVGGDAWELWGGSNRYVACVMPLFFILFAQALHISVEKVAGRKTRSGRSARKAGQAGPSVSGYVYSALIALSFLIFNSNTGPMSLSGFFFGTSTANYSGNVQMLESAKVIREVTADDARIAVTWAGALPYFSNRYTVDILGKTDKIIARRKMRPVEANEPHSFFYPGHMKFDYNHSFGPMKPDVIVQFWVNADETDPEIAKLYKPASINDWPYYFRTGSNAVLWDKLPRN